MQLRDAPEERSAPPPPPPPLPPPPPPPRLARLESRLGWRCRRYVWMSSGITFEASPAPTRFRARAFAECRTAGRATRNNGCAHQSLHPRSSGWDHHRDQASIRAAAASSGMLSDTQERGSRHRKICFFFCVSSRTIETCGRNDMLSCNVM